MSYINRPNDQQSENDSVRTTSLNSLILRVQKGAKNSYFLSLVE